MMSANAAPSYPLLRDHSASPVRVCMTSQATFITDEFAAISTGASRRDRLRFADGDALYLSGHSITSFIALPIRLYERAETGNGLADYQ
jgi:hypothetical protein